MKWCVKSGDILDEPADVLICSANPFLNLSGGVGGSFLLRYGTAMQDEMHAHLESNGVNFVEQGTVVRCAPHGSPYRFVLHAVAVDGMYQSSATVVRRIVEQCLSEVANAGASTIALAALATGFGNLTHADFAEGIKPLRNELFEGIDKVTIVVQHDDEANVIENVLNSE